MNTKTFTLALLLSLPTLSLGHVLESPIISMIDGKRDALNGVTIFMIKQYQHELRIMLLGRLQKDRSHIGKYTYDNKLCSVDDLAKFEQELGSNHAFSSLLTEMMRDFEKISAPFKEVVRSVKPLLEELVQESCKKRNRLEGECLLLEWAKPGMQDEHKLFAENIKSIKDFEIFMTDLHHFLSDLTESCKKGTAQFNDLLEKFKIVRSKLSGMNISEDRKKAVIDKICDDLQDLKKSEITEDKVKQYL